MLAPKEETKGPLWSALQGRRAMWVTQRSQLAEAYGVLPFPYSPTIYEPKSQTKRLSGLGPTEADAAGAEQVMGKAGYELQGTRANISMHPPFPSTFWERAHTDSLQGATLLPTDRPPQRRVKEGSQGRQET